MARAGQAVVLAMLAAFACSAAQAGCPAAGLRWMTGDWSGAGALGAMHQHWVTGAAGEMIGLTWGPNYGHPGDVVEMSAIAAEGNRLVLRKRHFDARLVSASEAVDDPITFAATACSANSVRFEGAGKWMGGDITFTHDRNTMIIDGHAHDNGRAGHFRRVLTKE